MYVSVYIRTYVWCFVGISVVRVCECVLCGVMLLWVLRKYGLCVGGCVGVRTCCVCGVFVWEYGGVV